MQQNKGNILIYSDFFLPGAVMSFSIGNNSLAQAAAGCEINLFSPAKGELCRQINRRYGYEFLRENKPEVT